jgi:hypothetical protein
MERNMHFKKAALLIAAGTWLGAFAATASAAECGSPGAQPCKPDRIAPKPVSTERIGKNPRDSKAERPDPPKRAAQPAADTPRDTGSRKPAPETQGAIDVRLSKIPDIIVPEPKGEARPGSPPPAMEPETEPGVAPLSPSDAARLHRDDPMP